MWRAHDITVEEYRSAFGLTGRGLLGDAFRETKRAIQKRVVAEHGINLPPRPTDEQRRSRRQALEHKIDSAARFRAMDPSKRGKRPLNRHPCSVCGEIIEKGPRRTCSQKCDREARARNARIVGRSNRGRRHPAKAY